MDTDKTPSQIAQDWLAGPRDPATMFDTMTEIAICAELLEDLLDDCLTVLDCDTEQDVADYAIAEAARIRGEVA